MENLKGKLILYVGPSGVGKGTVMKKLMKNNIHNLIHSVSVTTRPPRNDESNGKEYYFVTENEFKNFISNDELIEWVKFSDNYYGTLKETIKNAIKNNKNIVLEIEIEGAKNVLKLFPDSISIFMLPPSFEELKKRLINRRTETNDIIEKRLNRAKEEMKIANEKKLFTYFIENRNLDSTIKELNVILDKELT